MPEVEITLMDSVEKKVYFLRHIIRRLNLKGVEAIKARAEDRDIGERLKDSFDFVVSRAVSGLEDFLRLAMPYLSRGGRVIAMKGPKVRDELEAIKNYKPSVHEVEIPFSGRKTLLVICRKNQG
jgi:16S rRNA (guanine527-N7)-methyltransferase